MPHGAPGRAQGRIAEIAKEGAVMISSTIPSAK